MDSHTIFALLRDALAELYPEEKDSRVVVADAGLGAKAIAFSSRAQTNWHNILAAAAGTYQLDALLQVGAVALGYRAAADAPSGSATSRPRRPVLDVVHHQHW